MAKVIIIGYSGHAFVVCDAMIKAGMSIEGYCDYGSKSVNPFNLDYKGTEMAPCALALFEKIPFFISIGENKIRERVWNLLQEKKRTYTVTVIHPNCIIASHVNLCPGVFVAANTTINTLTEIRQGVICNTSCIIEHECVINSFAHIAPGAVLAGNVKIGERSFIGANSVVKQGINIGKDVIVGAGSVVIRDLPDGVTVVGNPARIIQPPNRFTN